MPERRDPLPRSPRGQVRVHASRSTGAHCAVCKSPGALRRCPGCDVRCHVECGDWIGSCPTLGCRFPAPRLTIRGRRRRNPPLEWGLAVWLILTVTLPWVRLPGQELSVIPDSLGLGFMVGFAVFALSTLADWWLRQISQAPDPRRRA